MMDDKLTGLYSAFPQSQHEERTRSYFSELAAGKAPKMELESAEGTLLLCFTNRCGSTWVGALLSEAGVFPAKTDGMKNFEFFNSDTVVGMSKAHGLRSMKQYISHLSQNYRGRHGLFSSKISADQLAWLTRAGLVRNMLPRPRFLHVRRRNTLAQAISFSIAMQTHQWTSNHENRVTEPEFRPKEIMSLHRVILMANAHFTAFFNLHGIEPLEIIYEDVLDNEASVLKKVGELIGKDLTPPEAESASDAGSFKVKVQRTSLNTEWEERMRKSFGATIGPLG